MTAIDALVARAAAILDARIGLKPDAPFRPRLVRALREVAGAHDVDPEDLLAAIGSEATLDELVDHVTVQETAFFRHPEQFDVLIDMLLPQVKGAVHVWSAASSNGQEAYSVAMTLREVGRQGSVLATDVARAAVRRTIDAVYDEREMRGVSPQRRLQHFTRDSRPGYWRVHEPLREIVTARRHNLLGPIPDEVSQCQIVLCRNVLIYFTPEHATRFLARLADAMSPEAHLIVGSTETIWHIDECFEPVRLGAVYIYRRRVSRPTALRSTPVSPARTSRVSTTTHADRAALSKEADVRQAVDARVAGENLLAAGDTAGAVVEFRRWAYSKPDDPLAHFHLGTALDDSDQSVAARRAFRAALAALDRADADTLHQTLEGFELTEFRRLLHAKSQPNGGTCDDPGRAAGKGATT
jgi:chemotaxis protein methyltransferase CheR